MPSPNVPAHKMTVVVDRAEAYKMLALNAYGRLLKLRKTMTQTGSPGVAIVQSTEELDILLQMLRVQLGPEADIYTQGQNRR